MVRNTLWGIPLLSNGIALDVAIWYQVGDLYLDDPTTVIILLAGISLTAVGLRLLTAKKGE